jgi:uncharacterized phosphosugar-binding protein
VDRPPSLSAAPSWDGDLALRLVLPGLTAVTEQAGLIGKVATELARRIADGGHVYTFGAGHATACAMELCSRAGGLRAYTSMSLEDLRDTPRDAHHQLADSEPERVPENGPALLERYRVTPRDALVVASQSGRNGAIVEMARQARDQGTYTVGIVSVRHGLAFPSRHPDGLRLLDVADAIVDNHCPVGDAAIELADGVRVAAASSIAFTLIAQVINARVTEALLRGGFAPEVIVSANVDAAPADPAPEG